MRAASSYAGSTMETLGRGTGDMLADGSGHEACSEPRQRTGALRGRWYCDRGYEVVRDVTEPRRE